MTKTNTRSRIVSILLVLVMLLTMVPITGVTANAADTSWTTVNTYDQLKAALSNQNPPDNIKLGSDIDTGTLTSGMGIIEPLEVLPKGTGCYYVEQPTKLCDETGEPARSTAYPKGFAPTYHAYTMDYPEKRKTPARIFVSSMGDLFGEWVPDIWIEDVFAACKRAPQHTYLFLTKNPQRYCDLASAGKLPTEPDFWYGTTITGPDMPFFFWDKVNTFVSVEPLLEPFDTEATGGENPFERVGWVIIGAMTGPGSRKQQPKREWVEAIVKKDREAGAAVFMKDSLKPIWGDDILREHPPGMIGGDNSG